MAKPKPVSGACVPKSDYRVQRQETCSAENNVAEVKQEQGPPGGWGWNGQKGNVRKAGISVRRGKEEWPPLANHSLT